jgi:hypothetical protein
MSCKITFESIIKFLEYDLLLKLETSSIHVEFYSLSNSFYFIILCYIEQKIYPFLWRDAISKFKFPNKLRPAGDYWHLNCRTLKVKSRSNGIVSKTSLHFLHVINIPTVSGSLSPQNSASSGYGWRNGLQYGG